MAVKLKNRLMSLVLAATLSLSTMGCSITNKNKKYEHKEPEKRVTLSFDANDKIIKLSNKYVVRDSLRTYFDYFNNYDVVYQNEELLLSAEERDLIINANNQDCDYVFDGDIDRLMNVITTNSINYLNTHSNYLAALLLENNNSVIDYKYLKYQTTATSYLEMLLKRLVKSGTNDINEDIHKMQDLKVVFSLDGEISGNSVVLGQYQPEGNLCILYLNSIIYYCGNDEQKIDETIKGTLYHEINHVRQHSCDCRLEKGQKNVTIGYDNDDYVSFIIESSAESALYNSEPKPNMYLAESNTYGYNYQNERIFESLLIWLSMFDDSKQLEDYYNAVFDSNIEYFCNFFDVKSEEEIIELYKIIYSYDAACLRNSFVDKYYSSDELEGLTIGDLRREVGFTYNISIFRWTLSNLIKHDLVIQNLSLDENIYLFNLLQFLVLDNSYYLEDAGYKYIQKYNRVYDDKFRKEFNELSNMFQRFLMDNYNISKSELDAKITSVKADFSSFKEYKYWDSVGKNLVKKFPELEMVILANPFINNDRFKEYESKDLKRNLSK